MTMLDTTLNHGETLDTEISHLDHDVCDDSCCIAVASIPGEGWE